MSYHPRLHRPAGPYYVRMLRPGEWADVDPREPLARPCDILLDDGTGCERPAVQVRGVKVGEMLAQCFCCELHAWVLTAENWSRAFLAAPPDGR